MKCPHCVREEKKSTLSVQKASPIEGRVSRYWDEEGNLHVHDDTVYRDVFQCSSGHTWMTEQKSRCPCQIGCPWNETRIVTPSPS